MATITQTGTRSRARRSTLNIGRLVDGLAIAILGVGAIFMVLPFLWMFSTSLRSGADAFKLPPAWVPRQFHFENYTGVFKSSVPFLRFGLNSVIVTCSVVAGQLLFCSMAAFAFARLRFPGRNLLFFLLLASLMVPGQVTIIPVFIIMRQLGLVDSLSALILPGLTSAFGVFLLRQFFLALPQDLVDAAKIDGAGPWTTFVRVGLPLVGPGLASLAIITFNGTWNNFFYPFIFINTWEKMTLPLGITVLRGYLGSGSLAVLMAGVTMAILPMLVFYLIAQRWFIQGVTQTGLKG
jgi:multiple sugar transport system permease protein